MTVEQIIEWFKMERAWYADGHADPPPPPPHTHTHKHSARDIAACVICVYAVLSLLLHRVAMSQEEKDAFWDDPENAEYSWLRDKD
jgi:hypothetical protein